MPPWGEGRGEGVIFYGLTGEPRARGQLLGNPGGTAAPLLFLVPRLLLGNPGGTEALLWHKDRNPSGTEALLRDKDRNRGGTEALRRQKNWTGSRGLFPEWARQSLAGNAVPQQELGNERGG